MSLDKLFRPQSVAIVGASPQQGNPRNSVVRALLKHGFTGRVYPVSPSHDEVEGLKAYRTVADLPEVPDVALVITPAKTVPGIIDECGARGIPNAIVFSSGFEETASGKQLAVDLAAAARRSGVTVVGPNCQGVWSVAHRAMMTYSPAAMNRDTIRHAPIAIISQSGALAGAISNSLQRGGLGCSYMVSVGNETVWDALDALDWVVEQDDVRVVALYIEGLNHAERLFRIAEKARAHDVQIVVLKAGRSALGQQATASHTGKIASSHAIYRDLLEQAGVILANGLAELLSAVEVLAYMDDPRVGGTPHGGVSVLTVSGGAGALLADHSSDFGIAMASFGAATSARLDGLLPDFAHKENPVDLTGQINTVPDLVRNTLRAVADDPASEAIILQQGSSGRSWLEKDGEAYKALAKELPVIVSFVGDMIEPDTRSDFLKAGVLLAADPTMAMTALSLLYRRERYRHLPKLPDPRPLQTREAPDGWAQTMAFCRDARIHPAKWIALGPDSRAAEACAAMRYPLVVKAMPSDSEHKTELGLVKLRVATPEDVDSIAREFRHKIGKPGTHILVQEMIGDGVEVVLSCLRSTDFGPILSIGTGGIAIELYKDITHLTLPATRDQVLTALRTLKLWTLLEGFRGRPAADIDALAEAAVALGDVFLGTPALSEFEINPVIVGIEGQGVWAVDALASVQPRRNAESPGAAQRVPVSA